MKFKWALSELRKQPKIPFIISGEIDDLKESLMDRNSNIIDVSPINISGTIIAESFDQFLVTATLKLEIVLPSTRSLQPTNVKLELPFMELYVSPDLKIEETEQDMIFQLEKHSIDLKKPIEDTVLTSLPLKVLTDEERDNDVMPTGNDWEMLSEEEYRKNKQHPVRKEQGNTSPFTVLKDLFPETDNKN